MITNFVVAVHFGVGGVVIQQARITGFGPVGLQSHSSFLRRHGGSSFNISFQAIGSIKLSIKTADLQGVFEEKMENEWVVVLWRVNHKGETCG
jgi:hypothetical protein